MSVEYYRKRLIDLRADVAKEREAKKRNCDFYNEQINKYGNTPSDKKYWREKKKEAAENSNRSISYLLDSIRNYTAMLEKEKAQEKAQRQKKNKEVPIREKTKVTSGVDLGKGMDELLKEAKALLISGEETKAVKMLNNILKVYGNSAGVAYYELFEYYKTKDKGYKKASTYGRAFYKVKDLYPDISERFVHCYSEMIIERCNTLIQQGKKKAALVLFNANLEYITNSDSIRFIRVNKLKSMGNLYM